MIRAAQPSDLGAILALVRGLYSEASPDYAYSEPRVRDFARACMSRPDSLAIVYGDDVRGVLLASYAINGFTGERIAEEHCIYVSPEARGRAGFALIAGFEAWAKQHNCAVAKLTLQHSIRPEAVSKLYRKHGYSEIETTFMRRL